MMRASQASIASTLPTFFNPCHYAVLNPDLSLDPNDKTAATNHYMQQGIHENRLCNTDQLVVNTEFGFEITTYIPYFLYLYQRGLLFDHVIHTYAGMEPYYYWLPASQIDTTRTERKPQAKHFLLHNSDLVGHINHTCWVAPAYKEHFADPGMLHIPLAWKEKPLLVISNKYNSEWGLAPVNFIDKGTLRSLVVLLQPSYQLVYIRPCSSDTVVGVGFSDDQNTMQEGLGDFDMLSKDFPDVLQFDKLRQANPLMSYNEVKCRLFALCDNFITVQGGGTNMLPFFARRTVVLHIAGRELGCGFYSGFLTEARPDLYADHVVVRNKEQLVLETERLFFPT